MAYRATVKLSQDALGLHARPVSQLCKALEGLDAVVVFSRSGETARIERGSSLQMLTAAASLSLISGTTFDVSVEGADAERAFANLEDAFTTELLEGCRFERVDATPEGPDV